MNKNPKTLNAMTRIRSYHAVLAVLCLFSYISGEWGLIHSYLGYGVAIVIAFRLFLAMTGERQLGLSRFYPDFEGLNANNALRHPAISKLLLLGIAVSVIGATTTGVMMDKGHALGVENAALAAPAYADDYEYDDDSHNGERYGNLSRQGEKQYREHHEDEDMEEIHEFFANMMLLFVAMHVSYLLLFKTPLARFMLYLPKARK